MEQTILLSGGFYYRFSEKTNEHFENEQNNFF